MTNQQTLKQALKNAVERVFVTRGIPARLGDGQGNLDVTDRPGYVWARIQYATGEQLAQVKCVKVRKVNNAPVKVSKNERGDYEAIDVDALNDTFWDNVGSPVVGTHALSHTWWADDPLTVSGYMFEPLRTQPTDTPSLSVKMLPAWYRDTNNNPGYFPGSDVDLTSYIPSTANEQRIVLTGLDRATGNPTIVVGTPEVVPPNWGAKVPFTGADVAAIPYGSDIYPSFAVRLYPNQTTIERPDIFLDIRDHLAVVAAGGGGDVTGPGSSVANNIAVFADTSGKVITDGGAAIADLAQFTGQTAAVYVSKIGNDSDDGLTPDKPKLTIGAAITAASALLTAGADAVRVEIQDGGYYAESFTVPSNVTLHGPAAVVFGEIALEDDSVVTVDRHYAVANDDIMVDRSSGGGVAYYNVNLTDGRGALGNLTGVLNIRNVSNGSVLHIKFGVLIAGEDGRGVSDTADAFGHTHFLGGDGYAGGDNAVVFAAYGAGSKLIGRCDHILEIGSPTGTVGIGLQNASASIIITVDEIIADTAYQINSGNLYLNGMKITGTQTGTPAYITPAVHPKGVNEVYAGPTSGADAVPTWRALVDADLPDVSSQTIKVKNTSGAAVAEGDVGYIDTNGEFKTTITQGYLGNHCIVTTGGANNADIYIQRKGRATVKLDGNCSVGDFLLTSNTAGQATSQSYAQPEIFARALTANASGAGGTCEAILLPNINYVPVPNSSLGYFNGRSSTNWSSTISSISTNTLIYNTPVTGNEDAIQQASGRTLRVILTNTTRSNDQLFITAVDTGTDTITFSENVPGTWQAGDGIQVNSVTASGLVAAGTYWFELDVSDAVPDTAVALTFIMGIRDTGGLGYFSTCGNWDAAPAVQTVQNAATAFFTYLHLNTAINNRRIVYATNASGISTAFTIFRGTGYFERQP